MAILDLLAWLHNGAGMSFQAQVLIKSSCLVLLLGFLMFVPDGPATRNKRLFPLRLSRYWLAVSSLMILGDYIEDGYAKHMMLANFYLAVVGMLLANRWAANKMVVYYEGKKASLAAINEKVSDA